MLEDQLKELALIVKNDDLRKYAGNAFWNLIQAVISKDPVSGTLAGKDVKQIVFHMPTVIFWNKIKRFLQGTYKDYEEQVKMASQFNNDNEKYAEFVKKQIYLIDKLEDDMKVDCFAILTRCLLLQEIEISLYFKLAQIINQCTPFELEYIRKIGINGKALKGNCLNYGDDTKCEVFKTYNDVSPLSISEPALMGDIKQLFIEEVDS